MDRDLARQLSTPWKDAFGKELSSTDSEVVKAGLKRAIGALETQDKTIGRLKLTLGVAIISILALGMNARKTIPMGTGVEQKDSLVSEKLPIATWVGGSQSFVFSPFSNDGLVDVSGLSPGTRVRCPMTGKLFIVPNKPIPDEADAFLKKYEQ